MRGVKIILGLILLVGCTMTAPYLFGRVWSEARHIHEFRPSKAKIVSYRCRNINLFMFNDCTIHYELDGKPAPSLTDFRFGRAPGTPPVLMETISAPRLISTNVSLETILNRAAIAVIYVGVLALVWLGLIGGVLGKMRRRQAVYS